MNESDLSEQLCQSKMDALVVKERRAKSLSLSGVRNCLLNMPGDHVLDVRFVDILIPIMIIMIIMLLVTTWSWE